MHTNASAEVGANIRAEMARRGVAQMTLAAAVGVSQSGLSKRLRGHTPLDVNELLRIAAFLDVPVNDLIPAHLASEQVPA